MPLTPAETIRKRTMNSPEIKSLVVEIIDAIDANIQEHRNTTNKIDHELPREIFIPGLTKQNAQRIVYYKVAKEILEKGYTLELTMGVKVIFHISWVADMDDADAEKINEFLAKHIRTPGQEKVPQRANITNKTKTRSTKRPMPTKSTPNEIKDEDIFGDESLDLDNL